ncbi:DUF1631 domain-containing protein [Marinimicrobium sp. C6131]|uniref:DUF1631 domain-containing protein n=1 Tax=Marinimicrobium sp. C6131 TaxID=3022676 RepID=UPI00223CB9D1|nr:DUF1631 domain-containing protein [Marinimicrobium sp. C6131]UZJ44789.1 DUF1631 domain-containing protein [Marinimicrobium sp. C6131]
MNDPVQPQRENVVPLNPERRQTATVPLARLPAAMHSVRDRARQTLQGLLRDLFDKADDSLFELADQATSNQEQNLYFDSMREVRLQRRALEQAFFLKLDQGFAALLEPGENARSRSEDDVSLEELTLVQNDELEQLVATESMVNKANEQFAEVVQHLTLRMDQLVPVKVYQKNNPLGADAICTGFTEAAKALKIDVKAKLVLFKLFDKWVVSRLGKMYESLNQQLIDANILPSLRAGAPANRRRTTAERPSQAARTERAQREDESSQVLHTLRDLLSSQGGSTGGPEEALGSEDLVHLLSQAQQQDWSGLDQGAGAVNVPQLVRGLVKNTRRQSLNQVDEDVINLVSMMFEFILDDRNLASPMKALLGRLQIPLIKVAIADKSFFSKGGHPARRLLNELAMAALGWQDSGEEGRRKDTFYQKVDQVVQTILADFESDVGIFDRMLLDFRAYQEKERRRARILEQRTLDAEDGKARAERARAEVDAALKRLTQGHRLAVAANTLLYEAWSKVLFIICLKQGTDSEDWQQALASAEQLVWSATAPMDRDNRQKLLRLVPELLPQLRAGLESIAYNPFEMNQLFKQLEQLHLSRLREASQPAPAPAPDTEPEQAEPAKATDEAETSRPDTTPAAEPEPEPEAALETPDQSTVFQVVDPVEETVPEAESVPSAEVSTDAGDEPLPASDPHMALVSNLTQGSWFERQDDQGQVFRCRLAAMIKPTGKYIFVNRSGMKVAEETREGLALALKSGRMRILDDGMLFDRALEAVIGNLRSSRAR